MTRRRPIGFSMGGTPKDSPWGYTEGFSMGGTEGFSMGHGTEGFPMGGGALKGSDTLTCR